eukprot:109605_1
MSADNINHQTVQFIVGITFLCINILILGPLILFGAYNFYGYINKNLVIFKRKPYIVIISSIIATTHICIWKSLSTLISIGILPPAQGLILFWQLIGHAFSIFPLHLSVLRFWCLYYELIWYKSNCNDQWQSVLNSSLNAKNWFILHKNTYGNIHWLKYRFVAMSLFLIFCCEMLIIAQTTKNHLSTQIFIELYSMFFVIP